MVFSCIRQFNYNGSSMAILLDRMTQAEVDQLLNDFWKAKELGIPIDQLPRGLETTSYIPTDLTRCECGSDVVKSPFHSPYCPKYSR